jgi:hypothetical protein
MRLRYYAELAGDLTDGDAGCGHPLRNRYALGQGQPALVAGEGRQSGGFQYETHESK